MYCKKCGNQMEDAHKVCTQCGTPRGQGTDFCPTCGAKRVNNSKFCSSCGYNFEQGANAPAQSVPTLEPTQPINTAPTQFEPPTVQTQPTTQAPVQPTAPVAPVVAPQQPQYPQQPQQPYAQQPQQQYPQQYAQQLQYQPQLKGYCRNCGTAFYANQTVCTQCGTKFGEGNNHCHHCGAQIVAGSEKCTQCGKSVAPPVTAGSYFKSLGNNFVSIIKLPVLAMITRNLPNLLSLAALILMFFPMVTYRHARYSYGYYAISAQITRNLTGFSGIAVALIIISLLVAIALYEPFTRSFLDKNKTLSKLSYLFVPVLHLLAGVCIGLSYLIKGSQSLNSFISIPEYNGLSFTVMGWVLIGLLVLSVVSGCIAFFTFKEKNNNQPATTQPVLMPQNPQNG